MNPELQRFLDINGLPDPCASKHLGKQKHKEQLIWETGWELCWGLDSWPKATLYLWQKGPDVHWKVSFVSVQDGSFEHDWTGRAKRVPTFGFLVRNRFQKPEPTDVPGQLYLEEVS